MGMDARASIVYGVRLDYEKDNLPWEEGEFETWWSSNLPETKNPFEITYSGSGMSDDCKYVLYISEVCCADWEEDPTPFDVKDAIDAVGMRDEFVRLLCYTGLDSLEGLIREDNQPSLYLVVSFD